MMDLLPAGSGRRIVLGADHVGVTLKEQLAKACRTAGYAVTDVGTNGTARVDYPDFANLLLAELDEHEAGILVCGTGVGMQIAANRHPLTRAAVIHDHFTAEYARAHNDANVACFGARVVTADLAVSLLGVFLTTPFEGGRHRARLRKLSRGPAEAPGAHEMTRA
jgi:ribose 5-phosphate isomerase B